MQKTIFSVLIVLTVVLLGCKQEKNVPKASTVQSATIQEMRTPAKPFSALPYLVSNKDKMLLSWVETENDSIASLNYATLIDGTWQNTQTIISGTDWFVNWADYPMIAENSGNLWSHILKKSSEETYSYDVKMNVRPKGTGDWKTNLKVHTDDTPTEHGFVSAVPFKDGFFVNWLDGRNTVENEVGERGAMTLRAALVSAHGELTQEHELDNSTCDCCQTTAAITANGPVVIYRDRSKEEVRDISIVRFVEGRWTTPKSIYNDNWNIKGCPVNGPKAAAQGNDLVVAWFTAAQNKPKVQVAFSTNGGEHFNDPIRVADGTVLGRVDVLWMDEDTAAVSWMETKDKLATLKAMTISKEGVRSKDIIIAKMDASRKSGFPQMEIAEETLYFAWTEYTEDTTQVLTQKMLVKAFNKQ